MKKIFLLNFVFVLVKAFLAKAKDEFQVKYDKPSQVNSFEMFVTKTFSSFSFSLQNTAKPEEFERIRTLGTGSFGRVMLVKHQTGNFYAMKILDKQKVRLLEEKKTKKLNDFIRHFFFRWSN